MNKAIKSNQEQAVASWINYLNQLRLDNLLKALNNQDKNLCEAIDSVNAALRKISSEIIATNRGGNKGMHGFIAEVAEVGVGNAWQHIVGKNAIYTLLDDNGPVDLLRNGTEIQQKFSMSGGQFSLGAVAKHLAKYPDYINNGGKYQIPKDHFETVEQLRSMSQEDANRLLTRGDAGPSLRQWRKVNDFFESNSLDIDSLEPARFEYKDVQRDVHQSVLEAEKESLRETDKSLRDAAHEESRPSLQEGVKVTATAAAIEGGTAFVLAVRAKRKEGKQFKDFSQNDWSDIFLEAGLGTAKGGTRGFSIYALTNFTATPAAVASSIVTAAFSIAEQAHLMRKNEISELQFVENAETVCIETAISALSSFVGQTLIPIPILGAVVGNTVGQIMHRAVSSSLSEREARLVEHYMQIQRELDESLAVEYAALLESLDKSMASYLELLDQAFSPDPGTAFLGAIELARSVGVPTEEILDSKEKTMAFFLD